MSSPAAARTNGPSSGPQTRAGWESKIQQQLDDLEKREAAVAVQEKRLLTLQVEAERVWERSAKLAAREAEIQQLEVTFQTVLDSKATVEAAQAAVERDREQLAQQEARLSADRDDFQRQCEAGERALERQRDEVARAAADVQVQRQCLAQEATRLAETQARNELQLEGLRAQINGVKAGLASAHRAVESTAADLRQREEQLAQRERLAKELLEVDDRARRNLRAAEQDVKRRTAAVAVAEAAVQADRALIDDESKRWTATRSGYEKELASFTARERELAQRASELHALESRLRAEAKAQDERADHLVNREIVLASEEGAALIATEALQRNQVLADADGQFARHQLHRATELHRLAESRRIELDRRALELEQWGAELQWREARFSSGAASALSVLDGSSVMMDPAAAARTLNQGQQLLAADPSSLMGRSAATADFNSAIVRVQEQSVRSLYNASVARRSNYVLSHNAQSHSAAANHREKLSSSRPSSAAAIMSASLRSDMKTSIRPHSAVPSSPSASSVGAVHVRDFDADAQLLAASSAASALSADFTAALAKLTALLHTSDLGDALATTRLSPAEQAQVLSTFARDADAVTEAHLWSFITHQGDQGGLPPAAGAGAVWPPADALIACRNRQSQLHARRVQDLEVALELVRAATASVEADRTGDRSPSTATKQRINSARRLPSPTPAILASAAMGVSEKRRSAASAASGGGHRPATAPNSRGALNGRGLPPRAASVV